MNIKHIEALIFDLGGTLYAPASDMCGLTKQFMIDLGVDPSIGLTDDHIKDALVDAEEWLRGFMVENNVPLHWQPSTEEWIEYDIILLKGLGVEGDIEALAELYQERWDRFFEGVQPDLIEGVKETLSKLRSRGFKLGIASNRFSDPKTTLVRDGIYELFEFVEYTAVPGYAKPSPYLLLRVAEKIGVNPRRCAYIGNIFDYDVVAAERAGMIPILLTWVDPHEEHKVTKDIIIIDHIQDLLEILE